jgi:oligosaccharide repeat unit polymerase
MLSSAFFEHTLIPLITLALWITLGLNIWLWKRWDAPATIMAFVWALISSVHLVASEEIFFPVHATTIGYLFVAVVAFSIGALFSWRIPAPVGEPLPRHHDLVRVHQRILYAFVALLVVTLPAYLRQALEGIELDGPGILLALRAKSLEGADEAKSFSPIRNLQIVSLVVAVSMPLVATREHPMRLARFVAIIIALIHGLATGSKAILPSLLVCMVFVHYGLRPQEFSILRLATLATLGLLGFLIALRFTAFAYVEGSWTDLMPVLSEIILSYITSPVIGLDQALRDQMSVSVAGQHPWRSVQFILNGLSSTFDLGSPEKIPSRHASFFHPGPGLNDAYNTYTFLIAYHLMGGPLIASAWMVILGFVLTSIFNRIHPSRVTVSAYYAILASMMVFSFGGDSFLLDLPNLLKMFVVCYLINTFLPRLLLVKA